MESDEYELVVRFKRSLSADREVIESRLGKEIPLHELRHEYAVQLARELQAAYDDPDVAPDGSFNVEQVILPQDALLPPHSKIMRQNLLVDIKELCNRLIELG